MRDTPQATDLLGMLDASETDLECRSYLAELRWPEGVVCPRCAATSVSRLKARRAFDCNTCRYQFSVTTGTFFHDSHLPLAKWFLAIFIICESERRFNARQLKRLLGISYKTAWYLGDRIGAAKVDVRSEQSSGPYFFRDVVQRLLDVGKFDALPLR